jgi:hypothetical protein
MMAAEPSDPSREIRARVDMRVRFVLAALGGLAVQAALIGGLDAFTWWRASQVVCPERNCEPQNYFGLGFLWLGLLPLAYVVGCLFIASFIGRAGRGRVRDGWWSWAGYASLVLWVPAQIWLFLLQGCSVAWYLAIVVAPPVISCTLASFERPLDEVVG